MKKNVIAVLLSVVLAAGSLGTAPVMAAETTTSASAEEPIAETSTEQNSVQEEEEAEEMPAQANEEETTESAQEENSGGHKDAEADAEQALEAASEGESAQSGNVEPDQEPEQTSEQEADAEAGASVKPSNEEEQGEEDTSDGAMNVDTGDETSEEIGEIEELQVIEEETEAVAVEEAAMAEEVVDSGSCGDNATWTLTGTENDLTLTISGSGAMYDYEYYDSPWYSRKQNITTVIVGDGITSIGTHAFYEFTSLASITISDSVTEIGDHAFQSCISLTSITIPDSVAEIGDYVFSGCSSLTSITIPDSMTKIGDYAFSSCISLTSINVPDSVTKIGDYAFSCCSSLASITISDSVTGIGDYAFAYCSGLTSITIPDSVTQIGDSVFDGCSSLASITMPDNITKIGNHTFLRCGNLRSIRIPDGVTKIGESAFEDCDSLRSIVLPDGVIQIERSAFYSCNNLKKITIPDTVTQIGESAFHWCNNLESITIPNGVTEIKKDTFKYCYNLASLTLSDSVSRIGNSAFEYCSGLTSVEIPDTVTEIGNNAFANSALSSIEIPYGVTQISSYIFDNCSNLTSVTLPNSVTQIGIAAFENCTSLENITLPLSVTQIDDYAFTGCDNLKKIEIHENVTKIGTDAFYPSDHIQADVYTVKNCNAHAYFTELNEDDACEFTFYFIDSSTPVSLTGIELPDDKTMEYGGAYTPEVTYIPEDTTDDKTVKWTSGNTNVFTVSKKGVVTPTGIGSADLTAAVGDFNATMKITVVKGTPAYETPEPIDAHCGQKLSELALPAGFAWEDPDADVGSAGENQFTVTYTPDDTEHFKKVEGISVLARVEHAFAEEWTIGSEQHWHECVCGEIADEAAHEYGSWKVTQKAGCETPGEKEHACTVCGRKETEPIPATGHIWEEEYRIDVEPTYEKEGSESIHCAVCGESKPGTSRALPKKDDPFSVNATFEVEKPVFNYTGKPIEPGVTVTYKGRQLEEGTDYSVAYSNNINLGMANIDVYGVGKYSGVKHLQFKIRIGATSKVTCTNVASGMKVSWTRVNGATRYKVYRDGKLIFTTSALAVTDKEVKYNNGTKYVYKVVAYAKGFGDSDAFRTGTCYRLMPVGIKKLTNPSAGKMTVTYDKCEGSTGYVVRYGLTPEMTDARVITVAGANTLSRTFSGMKKGKTYYVQVRTYKLDNGVRYYSGYCTTKTIKIMK